MSEVRWLLTLRISGIFIFAHMVVKNTDVGNQYIPQQYTGRQIDVVEEIELSSEAVATAFFKLVKRRFLCVNQWGEIAQLPMSTFKLTDSLGEEVSRLATKGDFIKIDIPGPGSSLGQGYDWVYIEELEEKEDSDVEFVVMRVRPAANPQHNSADVAHFLEDTATSTFQIKRIGNIVYAEEHGRNENVNSKTDNFIDNLRNTVVGLGAKLGLSYPQWKSLVKGLLRKD